MRIGIHTSIAKSLENAALLAHSYGANALQIFSASPRMWRAVPPCGDACALLQATRERLDIRPLIVHDSYLINLASPDPVIRARSIAAFREELERCLLIGADYLVAHPGNHKGQTIAEAIPRFADGVSEAARGLAFPRLMLLLENTAGSGASLGSSFCELAGLRQACRARTALPIGYCLDTAHLLAAGYDIATAKGLRHTLAEAELIIGLDHVHVIHSNDSKVPLGSRVDRHEHIGAGHIGFGGFRRILNHPRLQDKTFILETPQKEEGDEIRNVRALQTLCQRSRTTTA